MGYSLVGGVTGVVVANILYTMAHMLLSGGLGFGGVGVECVPGLGSTGFGC